jgi:hypothetical protein
VFEDRGLPVEQSALGERLLQLFSSSGVDPSDQREAETGQDQDSPRTSHVSRQAGPHSHEEGELPFFYVCFFKLYFRV